MITSHCIAESPGTSQKWPMHRLVLRHGLDDVGVTGVGDAEHAHAVQLTAGGTQVNVV